MFFSYLFPEENFHRLEKLLKKENIPILPSREEQKNTSFSVSFSPNMLNIWTTPETFEQKDKLLSLLTQKNIFVPPQAFVMGSDETGIATPIGPVVVATACANRSAINKLAQLGIKDSKRLSFRSIIKLYKEIKNIKGLFYEVYIVEPQDYNRYISIINKANTQLTAKTHIILSYMHIANIYTLTENLKKKNIHPDIVYIDRYISHKNFNRKLRKQIKNLGIENVVISQNAEKYIIVATASIIARYFYLLWNKKRTEQLEIELTKKHFVRNKNAYRKYLSPLIEEIGVNESFNLIKFISPTHAFALYKRRIRNALKSITKKEEKKELFWPLPLYNMAGVKPEQIEKEIEKYYQIQSQEEQNAEKRCPLLKSLKDSTIYPTPSFDLLSIASHLDVQSKAKRRNRTPKIQK